MSWKASAWAREQKGLDTTEKLLLLLIADYCDDRGACWPSVPRLAAEMETTVRTVQRAISKLELKRMLRRDPRWREDGSRTTNGIQLLMNGGGQVTPVSGGGDNLSPGVVTRTSPHEPISKNHTTPCKSPGGGRSKGPKYPRNVGEMRSHPEYDRFREVWTELPNRAGSDPELTGFQAYLTHASREAPSHEVLVEAAKRYAAWCDAMEFTATEKVMQGSRFLGRNQEWNQDWEIPVHSNGRHS